MTGPDRGKLFVRTVRALAIAKGNPKTAIAWAQSQNWHNSALVIESIKSTVAALGRDDPAYTGTSPSAVDFADFIRPLTVLGRLTGLRRAPERTRMIAATSGSGAYWAGEKQPRPISRMTFAGSVVEQLSVIAVLVATTELIASSSPDAESILSRDLAAAAVAATDSAFLDPGNSGIANVKPSSITNGVTAIHSSGSTLAAIDYDLQLLIEALSDAGSDLTHATFIIRPRTALYLSLLRGSGGAKAHPDLSVKGGLLAGLPCLVSNATHSDAGSPAEGGTIILVDPSQILVSDSGDAEIEVSAQASLAMADNPSSPSTLVSMWQTNSLALKTKRYLGWSVVRPGMAQMLDVVNY